MGILGKDLIRKIKTLLEKLERLPLYEKI